MNSAHLRSVRLVAVLLVVAVAVSGCGSGGDPLKEAVAAVESTRALSGTSYLLTLPGQRLSSPPVELPGGKAAYDLKAGVGYEALTVRGRSGKRTIYLDFLPSGVLVAPWPTPAGLLPPGKMWISIPPAGTGSPGVGDPLLAQLEGLSPELALDEIAWGARSASSLGSRTLNHVPMKEYRVSVDLAKALAGAKRSRRPAIEAAIEAELRAAPSGRKSVEVWVTGPGHVGRIDTTPSGTGLGKASFQFTSFDALFNRNRPRASQTVPLAKVAEPSSHSLWTIATGA